MTFKKQSSDSSLTRVENNLAKAANATPSKSATPRLWSLLWRGAVGGALGMFIAFCYLVYENPYNVLASSYLPSLLLIGAFNGVLIAGIISLILHFSPVTLGIISRILVGTILTSSLIALYLYFHEGFGPSLVEPIGVSLLLGFLIGGLPGAMARDKVKAFRDVIDKRKVGET